MRGPEAAGWKKYFDAELQSLKENGVYGVVDRLRGKKVFKVKWVLRRTTNPNGSVDKLKARVVEKWFTQRAGLDYDRTFSPTVRSESIRMMVAAAAAESLHTHHMDMTIYFLYASLEEEVYMEVVDGIEGAKGGNKVARL